MKQVSITDNGVATVIDLMSSTIAGNVHIGQLMAARVAFNPAGTKAYVAVQANQLYGFDTATLTVKTKTGIGQAPLDVPVSFNEDLVWVDAISIA